MLPHFEKVLLKWDQSFQVRALRLPRFTTPWHFHPEFELMWIAESRGQRFVGNSIEAFAAGDLVLIGSNVPHLWKNEAIGSAWSQARATVVKFHPDFMGPGFFSKPELAGIRQLLDESARGVVFNPAEPEVFTRHFQRLALLKGMDALLALLALLHRLAAEPRRLLASAAYVPSQNRAMEARVGKIYKYLMEEFREPLTLPQIARRAGMTPAAFSRFFKRVSRRNVSVFLNDLRIDHASREMLQTRRTVTAIAFDSGFATLSSFNRRFRERVGCSPRQYRQSFQNSLQTTLR